MSAQQTIAVALDGPPTPAWQARVLAGLERSAAVEVVERRLIPKARLGVARRVHLAGERHVFKPGPDPDAPVGVEEEHSSPRSPATLLLWLATEPVPHRERRPLISLRHEGIEEPFDEALRRALLGGRPLIVSEVVLRSDERAVIVDRTASAIGPASELVSRTLALWKLADLIPRAIERLPGLNEPAPAPSQAGSPPPAARLLLRDIASWTRAPATRLVFRRPWQIRVRERSGAPTRGWEHDQGLVRWGDARLYADPFLFEHEGRHHLFCEEVPRGGKQGVISHTELHPSGAPASAPTPVLVAPYHVSYPCVFAHQGEIFMIPETCAARRIELYRAVTFPHSWRLQATLADDVLAADATLFHHDGRLWLFATVAAPGASYSDELHIFSADTPTGPWRAHPRNPVVSDVRGARPAGAIQVWGSRIVRPAQDCSRRYGWALSFREIDTLDDADYAEHEIDRIEPEGLDARATHTYASDGRFEAIDLRRRELRLPSKA